MIQVKEHEFKELTVTSSASRRAVLFQNNIIAALKKLGLHEDDVEIKLERLAIRRAPASAEWYMDGYYCHFSYSTAKNFLHNLYIVSKVIELEVENILAEKQTRIEFAEKFAEEQGIEKRRKQARKLLGVPSDCIDLDVINRAYKKLAKSHHPDMGGDMETFKEINTAHKILKKELE